MTVLLHWRSFKVPFSEFTTETSATPTYESDEHLLQKSVIGRQGTNKGSGSHSNITFSQTSDKKNGHCS